MKLMHSVNADGDEELDNDWLMMSMMMMTPTRIFSL
jgi:hypothetical protein